MGELNRSSTRHWLLLGVIAAAAVPSPVLRLLDVTGAPHPALSSGAESAIFGLGILAAAFLLTWVAEVAEQEISATLALAFLALIAVLPEYAVDIFFAWTAPGNPEHAGFALANMTGANRLLVGFAWPLVFVIFWLRERNKSLEVGRQNSLGIVFLGAATIYSFTIPLRQHVSLIDTLILMSLFGAYLYLSSRTPPREAELVGPAATIGALPTVARWGLIIGAFVFSAGVILAAAEPFAEGLVDTGRQLGIDEFILVQWLAPLASEAPEFLLAAILAARGRAGAGMTVLISSKVNQWTLLVGSLPVAYSISGTTLEPLPMESRQVEEVFLTAAQSLFAVSIFISLSINFWEAALLFVLFGTQLGFTAEGIRYGYGFAYLALAVASFLYDRRFVPQLFQAARETVLQTPPANPPGPRKDKLRT